MKSNFFDKIFKILPLAVLAIFLLAGYLYLTGSAAFAVDLLKWFLLLGLLPLVIRIIRDLLNGSFGIDIIAIVAIAGAWLLAEYWAGLVILLMLSSGEALEDYARGRARAALDALLALAPRIAHIKKNNEVIDVPVEQIKPEDLVVIKPGETIPVDGLVIEGVSEVDESAITGEPVPVKKTRSSMVLSGSINKNQVLEIKALKSSADSKYQEIVRLVREAEREKAPLVRLADRYSIWFTLVTLFLSGLAWWWGDALRALSVLVVATPCPLILATPIAMVSAMNRASSRGIIIKNSAALERLADAKIFVFDKTGTLTIGTPQVRLVESFAGRTVPEVLGLSASLDQLSVHVLAKALVEYAQHKGMKLDYPEKFKEFFGDGTTGVLGQKTYFLGKLSFIKNQGIPIEKNMSDEHEKLQQTGEIAVYLSDGEHVLGRIHFQDQARPQVKDFFRNLLKQGIVRIIMLTGDRNSAAAQIAEKLNIKEFRAELLPEDKVAEIKELMKSKQTLVMVGDGVNDAPALATADVGIALGAHGSSAASEAGDVVVTIDNLERVGEALEISRRGLAIAKQSIFVGISLSLVLMVIALFGYIKPIEGALLQEVIDVVVIFNALRVNRIKLTQTVV
ncbi:MAG: heavy metal translocating P-type ATPase [Candidatus Doudnabacteria bacterium]